MSIRAPTGQLSGRLGNISRTVTEQDLKEPFEALGAVQSVAMIEDKFSGESRGFGGGRGRFWSLA
jgi:RNA recognition motif-containing protein